MEMVGQESTKLLLPGIFSGAVILEDNQIDLSAAQINVRSISESILDTPEFVLPERKLHVHLVTHRKPLGDLTDRVYSGETSILAIDVRAYLRLWWETCDANRSERIQSATTATELMKSWLGENESGHDWVYCAEFAARVEKHNAWIEANRTADERRHIEKQRKERLERETEERERHQQLEEEERLSRMPGWSVPAFDTPAFVKEGKAPVAFFKPVKPQVNWLTDLLAHEHGLVWDSVTRQYGYCATQNGVIGPKAQQLFEVSEPWQPIYEIIPAGTKHPIRSGLQRT